MYRYLIAFMFFTMPLIAQNDQHNLQYNAQADSLSYSYFVAGQWNELVAYGKTASSRGVDFKYLQQRMGYAYFVKQNYYAAIKHYQKALAFDANDSISHLYLHYSALNINNQAMARYHASKLNTETQNALKTNAFRAVDAVDLEYNYKINNYDLRDNPTYKRIGLNTQLGYRLSLYQSLSSYNQITDYSNQTIQNEYYVSANYSLFSRTNLMAAYHYVGTKFNTETDSLNIPGNLWFAKLSHNFGRFNLSISQSQFSNEYVSSQQTGFHLGYSAPTRSKIQLQSSVYRLTDDVTSRWIFNQTIGALFAKHFWLQGGVTLGNLNNFTDNNALYLYNSMDRTTFRTNASLFYYWGKHLILYSNYGYDKKQTSETQYLYNQHSITGGIIWKL